MQIYIYIYLVFWVFCRVFSFFAENRGFGPGPPEYCFFCFFLFFEGFFGFLQKIEDLAQDLQNIGFLVFLVFLVFWRFFLFFCRKYKIYLIKPKISYKNIGFAEIFLCFPTKTIVLLRFSLVFL